MNISAPFIQRPVATTLLTVAIIFAGAIAYKVLPVSPLPQVDFPTISVSANLPGASADIMASSVATPLERQFGHIAGVTEMTSSNSLGSTSITIQFDLNRNIDGAARDVQAAINAARTYLPANLPSNPSYRKVNPADAPIMILGLTSDKFPAAKLYDEASTVIQQKLSQIQGVGQVSTSGSALPSVRVDVNPTKLANYGLAMSNVQSVLSLQNAHSPRGQISDGIVTADIITNDQISLAEEYKPLIIGYSKGAAIKLSDVADVTDSVQNIRTGGYLYGVDGEENAPSSPPGGKPVTGQGPVPAGGDIQNPDDKAKGEAPVTSEKSEPSEAPEEKSVDKKKDDEGQGNGTGHGRGGKGRGKSDKGKTASKPLVGKRAITIIIYRQPGANIIETVDRLKEAIVSVKASIPKGIQVTTVLDRTTTIRASVVDVERTLVISVVLVVVVVFIFLRNWRATLIPGIAVPASLIGTCAIMYLCGYSIDNLSLMALTIATGFVVDDAIVVMENISRYLEEGMTPMKAALKGAGEVGFTVFSISISLIAVFIPLLLMGGIVGRLFREFAVVLSTAVLVSMAISLTTTPMMCAYILKHEAGVKHGRLYRASEAFFDWILKLYRISLEWVLDHSLIALGSLALTIALTIVLAIQMPKGFFPQQDTGSLMGGVEGPQDSSYDAMNTATQALGAIVASDPAVSHAIAFTGGQGATNTGRMFITLKPLEERNISAADVINRLRPKLNKLTGASAFLQASQDIRIGGRSSNAMYQYSLQSDSSKDLAKWGPILKKEMEHIQGLQDVNTDQQNGGRDEMLTLDRVTAAKLGLTVQSIDSALYSAFGQSEVSVIYTQLNQYYVVLEVAPQYWATPDGLKDVFLASSVSGRIPLFALAKSQSHTIPLAINHTSLFPSVTISFNLAPNVALSEATERIDAMKQRLGVPSTLHTFFAGTLQAYQASLSTLPILVITALLAVYIVLGMLYESLVHPITIILTLPSAGVGAMLSLKLFGLDLNVISIIGIVLLIGIVKKNAIMMIDFAIEAERNHGKGPADAIFEACLLRFRPIMMTTMAALFGALPLAFGTGTGSELRQPLGISIVGGLIVSQLLTLYTTPVVYLTFDRIRLWVAGGKHDVFHHHQKTPGAASTNP